MTARRREEALEEAARAAADGEMPAQAEGDIDPTVEQLAILAEIARLHRTLLSPRDPNATIGVPPPASLGSVSSTWAHFHVIEQIAAGTSGIVHRAWDGHLAREVALKLRVVADDEPAPMVMEARYLGRVRHPHFVTVYGIARAEGHVGTWMELLKGRTLHDLVVTNGTFNAHEAALIGADICSALAAVHGAGLLHRDVKPSNVVREHAGGRVVLLDLSASRETEEATADLAGTPLYLAPELFAGAPATVRSDIYSVGALLWFLTTGVTPASTTSAAGNPDTRARDARSLRDLRPDLPRGFVEIVERATARNPADRFASAGELETALAAFLSSRAATASPALSRRRFPGAVPVGVAAGLIVVAAVLASLGTVLITNRTRPGTATESSGTAINPLRVIATDQLQVARAMEDLAASFAERGDWNRAVDEYRAAERVYRVNTSADAPLVARAVLHVAWAQHQQGDLEAAASSYELAIAKCQEFDLQPLISAAQMALADVRFRLGHAVAPATAIGGALDARARMLGLNSLGDPEGLSRIGVTSAQLATLSKKWSVSRDQDHDWLPDLIEAAVGLDPRSSDSDHDGVADTFEDHDRDGLSNDLEFGVPVDPTRIIFQYGGNDPEWLGFQQPENRRTAGQRSTLPGDPAWHIDAFGYTQYFWPLSTAERQAALSRGWRVVMRGVGNKGRAYANLDLGPQGNRFDLDFEERPGQGWQVQRNTKIVPSAGIADHVSDTGDWGVVDLLFDPTSLMAALVVNGKPVASPAFAGHDQFREGLGLAFGNLQVATSTEPGRADFRLVMLVIR